MLSLSDVLADLSDVKNVTLHHKTVTTDIEAVKTDFTAGQYFKAGEAAADLVTVAIGPVKAPSLGGLPFPIKAVPEFIGGLLEGFVGDNNLTEIQNCVKSVENDSVEDIEKIIQDVKAGDINKVIGDVKALQPTNGQSNALSLTVPQQQL